MLLLNIIDGISSGEFLSIVLSLWFLICFVVVFCNFMSRGVDFKDIVFICNMFKWFRFVGIICVLY